MQDSSKELDDSSKCDKLALPSSPKGEIVGIMRQVLSLMANHTDDRSQCSRSAARIWITDHSAAGQQQGFDDQTTRMKRKYIYTGSL